jgi:hypothetical protein
MWGPIIVFGTIVAVFVIAALVRSDRAIKRSEQEASDERG